MFQPGANLYTQGFGSRPENVEVPHYDVRAPTTTDILYPIGKQWVWSAQQQIWELVQITSTQGVTSAVWVQLTNQSTGAATTYNENSGSATPIANVLNVVGGTGVTTTGSGNTITIDVTGDGFNWVETSTSFTAAFQTGYYANAALTATLPSGTTLGQTIVIYADTSSAVVIQAAVGQRIQVSNMISSSGGTATSNAQGAMLQLNFKPSDSTWHTISSMGTWTVA